MSRRLFNICARARRDTLSLITKGFEVLEKNVLRILELSNSFTLDIRRLSSPEVGGSEREDGEKESFSCLNVLDIVRRISRQTRRIKKERKGEKCIGE